MTPLGALLAHLACVAPDSGAVDTNAGVADTAETGESVDSKETGDSADSSDSSDTADTEDTSDSVDTDTSDDPLPLCINEFMPDNASSAFDGDGLPADWIELHNPGTTDIDLTGWALTDDPANTNKSELLPSVLPAGGYALFWAVGDPPSTDTGDTAEPSDTGDAALAADELSFRLSSAGGAVGVFAPDGRGSVIRYGTVEEDYSVARTTNCCTGADCLGFDFRGSPGYSNEPLVYDSIALIGTASVWRYWADATVDDGWYAPDYPDSPWIDGEGPLGYGDTQTTVIPYGSDPYNKWPTAWFRRHFTATDVASFSSISLYLLRDDGAAVYLNGVEIIRDNLPAGDLTASTLAITSTGSETTYYTYPIDAGLVLEGDNDLAVEVHQASVDSSDLTFDLALIAERLVP